MKPKLNILFLIISIFSLVYCSQKKIISKDIDGIHKPGFFMSPNKQCSASLTTSSMGGFLLLTINSNQYNNGENPIKDVNGIQWLNNDELLYTASPIYGLPGVFIINCKIGNIKNIITARNISDAYPNGADYFELKYYKASEGVIYFYFVPDVDTADMVNLRTPNYLYKIKLDGSAFEKTK